MPLPVIVRKTINSEPVDVGGKIDIYCTSFVQNAGHF